MGYEDTRLWVQTLGKVDDDPVPAAAVERLRVEYLKMREKAALLASDISRLLPEYTVHDITHLDALWEVADLIGASELDPSPLEGFVLGGAFLIHDLAMGLSAWPGGLEALMAEDAWTDALVAVSRQLLSRTPTDSEINQPSEEVHRRTVEVLLRRQHAFQAARICTQQWPPATGQEHPHYFIEDRELRDYLGDIIGRIAASHWLDCELLPDELGSNVFGPPAWCPRRWTLDPLVMACVLRVADAAHIDHRRASSFLRATRPNLSPTSQQHWIFQERLGQPVREEDRLVFSSPRPFAAEEAGAWWLLADCISTIDRELRSVDHLLADFRRHRLPVKRVAGASNPEVLARYVGTKGWSPINAGPWVPDARRLMMNLGGRSLYGRSARIPIRELLQNAIDASVARSLIDPVLAGRRPRVEVRLDKRTRSVVVRDYGIGMSDKALVNGLLGFGSSYWETDLSRDENPGLLANGFDPAGRYGIGFFSVFMLGDDVVVRTRRHDSAPRDTLLLEFSGGLNDRPVLRAARPHEYLAEAGTEVLVRLRESPTSAEGILGYRRVVAWKLEDLCAYMAPASPCDIVCQTDDDGWVTAVHGDDWMSLTGLALLERLLLDLELDRFTQLTGRDRDRFKDWCSRVAEAILPIQEGDRIVGRCAASPSKIAFFDSSTHVWAGGFVSVLVSRGTRLDSSPAGLVGIVEANPERATREAGRPVAGLPSFADWATAQAKLDSPDIGLLAEIERNLYLHSLRGDLADRPIGVVAPHLSVSIEQAARFAIDSTEVPIYSTGELGERRPGEVFVHDQLRGESFELATGVLYMDWGPFNLLEDWPHRSIYDTATHPTFETLWELLRWSTLGAILQEMERLDGMSVEDRLNRSGVRFGQPVTVDTPNVYPVARCVVGRSDIHGDRLDVAFVLRW